jgi:hypothetical protein
VSLTFGQLQSLVCLPLQSSLCVKSLHTLLREHHSFVSIVTGMPMKIGVIRYLKLSEECFQISTT